MIINPCILTGVLYFWWMGNWVDKLLDNIFSEPETIKLTFKGKATTDQFEIIELGRGCQDGFDYAFANWTEGSGFEVFPKNTDSESGYYWNGWAEGVKSAISKRLTMLYPGARSLSYNQTTKKYDATY